MGTKMKRKGDSAENGTPEKKVKTVAEKPSKFAKKSKPGKEGKKVTFKQTPTSPDKKVAGAKPGILKKKGKPTHLQNGTGESTETKGPQEKAQKKNDKLNKPEGKIQKQEGKMQKQEGKMQKQEGKIKKPVGKFNKAVSNSAKDGKGKMPFKKDGKAPFKGEGKAPFKGEGKAPFKGEGKAPFKGEGKAPFKGEGKAPFKREGKPSMPYKGKFNNKSFNKQETPMKPTDWADFKKKKKELRLKRRQSRPLSDSTTVPKQLAEKIRCKNVAPDVRTNLIDKLHDQVKGKGLYAKFVLTHDMARVVQVLLKYGSPQIRAEIAKELIPVTVQMFESKYGKFCVKRMFKYSTAPTRSSIIKATYGSAVKLTSHTISAPIYEYAYSTWATHQEKFHLIQEFFGDMYKNSKDDNVKHLRDVFKNSPDMKVAALGATKANLSRILNKDLLDSGLAQSVLFQYLSECSHEDKMEMISQLAAHVVVLSNSKDGARVVMNCIWHGTNKDRKVVMKALKEHVLELSKHEHGHTSIIALLDAADDTVLLNKMIIGEIVNNSQDLSKDEWGRKVLLWLVAPADSSHFHPLFIKELERGRESSTTKKSPEIRRKEILGYASSGLLKAIQAAPKDWLSSGSLGIVTLAILKTGSGEELQAAFKSIAEVIADPEWKIKENDAEVLGIEHAGLHMTLKKIAQHDKVLLEKECSTFGEVLVGHVDDSVITLWLSLNRGCFFLLTVFENGSESTQEEIKEKLKNNMKVLKKQTSPGSKILLKKVT